MQLTGLARLELALVLVVLELCEKEPPPLQTLQMLTSGLTTTPYIQQKSKTWQTFRNTPCYVMIRHAVWGGNNIRKWMHYFPISLNFPPALHTVPSLFFMMWNHIEICPSWMCLCDFTIKNKSANFCLNTESQFLYLCEKMCVFILSHHSVIDFPHSFTSLKFSLIHQDLCGVFEVWANFCVDDMKIILSMEL